jgi:hypothetical protein
MQKGRRNEGSGREGHERASLVGTALIWTNVIPTGTFPARPAKDASSARACLPGKLNCQRCNRMIAHRRKPWPDVF